MMFSGPNSDPYVNLTLTISSIVEKFQVLLKNVTFMKMWFISKIKAASSSLWRRFDRFSFMYMKALRFSHFNMSSVISIVFLMSYIQLIRRLMEQVLVLRVYNWTGSVCKEILFHITYYYFTKCWLYLMKGLRIFTEYTAKSAWVITQGQYEDYVKLLMPVVYSCLFLLILFLSRQYEDFNTIRLQYFTWFTINRPLATEMGPSAHLLVIDEQIPRIKLEKQPAYKTQRSTSTDYIRRKTSQIPRYSYSYTEPTSGISFESLIKSNEETTSTTDLIEPNSPTVFAATGSSVLPFLPSRKTM